MWFSVKLMILVNNFSLKTKEEKDLFHCLHLALKLLESVSKSTTILISSSVTTNSLIVEESFHPSELF